MNWQDLRKLTEKWQWRDPKTNVLVRGYNPPEQAKEKQQVSFYIKYLTLRGVVEEGHVICLKVFLDKHQRLIQFTESKQIRRVCDILIMEVDGIRIICD